jgi:hypothetical protein
VRFNLDLDLNLNENMDSLVEDVPSLNLGQREDVFSKKVMLQKTGRLELAA